MVKRKKRLKEIENGKKILLEREREIGTRERKREIGRRERTLYYLFYDARIHGRTEKGTKYCCYDIRVEEED